jgi:signal peptidase I
VVSAIASVVLVALTLFFAPARFGGDFVYYRVNGTSMEPMLHGGDLVLLRRASTYEVGDAVAYRDPTLGVVLHQVRAIDGNQFIMRGVNRHDDDPYRPTAADISGKLWLHVPGGGTFLRTVETPRNAVLLLVAAGALSTIPMRKQVRRRARPGMTGTVGAPPPSMALPILGSAGGDTTAILAIVAIVGAIALVVVLRSGGPMQEATTDALIQQVGTWAYGTSGAGVGVYDGDRLTTGQPVFTAINDSVPAQFVYTIAPLDAADIVTDVRGTVRVAVELSAANKWSRMFELVPSTPFEGAAAVAQTTLDIRRLLAMVATVQDQTRVEFGTYRMRVLAQVQTTAMVNGEPLDQALTTTLPFDLTTVQLLPSGDPAEPTIEVAKVAKRTLVPWSITVPVVRLHLTYDQLRMLAVGLGVGGTVGVLLVGVSTAIVRRKGEGALIRARHRALLVVSTRGSAAVEGRVIPVEAFSELLRVATYEQTFIVDAPEAGWDHFLVPVRGSACTYLYATPRPDETNGADLPPLSPDARRDQWSALGGLAITHAPAGAASMPATAVRDAPGWSGAMSPVAPEPAAAPVVPPWLTPPSAGHDAGPQEHAA